ncbi:ribonuclease HI [Thermodesulfobacterium commune]|uniref:Ribonuclease H n=1 Tax=Thermodesulfobacterium commune DSM 2178 TaxID=289377 RepID=A0A075WS18_9BACT|nr:ribonuclease HI [Thermodesulfobacterium commune]AIH03830.1 ribonuclease H [Thermodesulfobacterium commune DSM 2178]
MIKVYVDGACLGNPGPGGWAVLILDDGREHLITGGEEVTTNNRMELEAVLQALSFFKEPTEIIIFCDSEYVIKGATEWLSNWKKRGYRTADGKPIKNRDLWEKLDELLQFHKVFFQKVAAHSGDPLNEKVDQIAKESAQRWKKDI